MRVRIADEATLEFVITKQPYESNDGPVVEICEADYHSYLAAVNAYDRWQRMLGDPEWLTAHAPG